MTKKDLDLGTKKVVHFPRRDRQDRISITWYLFKRRTRQI